MSVLTSIQANLNVSSDLSVSPEVISLFLCTVVMNIPIGLSLSPFFPQSFSHRPDDGHGMTAALNPPH